VRCWHLLQFILLWIRIQISPSCDFRLWLTTPVDASFKRIVDLTQIAHFAIPTVVGDCHCIEDRLARPANADGLEERT